MSAPPPSVSQTAPPSEDDSPAGPDVEVIIESEEWRHALGADPEALVRGAALAALDGAVPEARASGSSFDPARAELAVVLSDDAAVRRLNRDHRGRDRATNVLSFPLAGAPLRPAAPASPRPVPDAPLMLGDVVLALGTVVAESRAHGIPVAEHASHLVVHGVLHLLGHDHGTDAEAARMEALEAAILARLGIPDPYQRDPQETDG